MKRGLYLAPFDELANPRLLAEFARLAESRGWDGLFLWDRITYPLETAQSLTRGWRSAPSLP
jgi:alkanesulfonate monooxygenase SsuD/methylene tetrahydromethanopterin reductase-like flavin-dependent oxidoreductase (luciferase family)